MGVYVFGSKHADFIKVGHYVGEDPWGRVQRRGFYSCVSPRELRYLRSAQDLELLGWFPRLRRKHEGRVHRRFSDPRTSVGEWHSAEKKQAVLEMLAEEERLEENNDDNKNAGGPVPRSRFRKNRCRGSRGPRQLAVCSFPHHFLISDDAEYAFVDDAENE